MRGKVADDKRKDEMKILWDEDDGRSRHCDESGGSSRKREDDIVPVLVGIHKCARCAIIQFWSPLYKVSKSITDRYAYAVCC